MLGVSIGGLIEIKYDLLSLIPHSSAPFQQVVFDYKPQPGGMSRGELFMDLLDLDHEILVIDAYNYILRQQGIKDKVIIEELPFGIDNLTPLYLVLDRIFEQMIREDFHFVKNY